MKHDGRNSHATGSAATGSRNYRRMEEELSDLKNQLETVTRERDKQKEQLIRQGTMYQELDEAYGRLSQDATSEKMACEELIDQLTKENEGLKEENKQYQDSIKEVDYIEQPDKPSRPGY